MSASTQMPPRQAIEEMRQELHSRRHCKCGALIPACDHPSECCDCFDAALERDIVEIESPFVPVAVSVSGLTGVPLADQIIEQLQHDVNTGELVIPGLPDGAELRLV